MKRYWNKVVDAPDTAPVIVNPRRGITFPLPALSPRDYFDAKRQMFERFGLEDFVDVVSAEPAWRQSPHVTELGGKLERVQRMFARLAPSLYSRMRAQLVPTTQLFNKDSRLGWPYFCRPGSKAEVVAQEWDGWVADKSTFANAYTVQNIRLQAEPRGKVRSYQVPLDDYSVVDRDMDDEQRALPYGNLAARARLVFNKPVLNLMCQVVDTVLNKWLGKQPLCHHDMYGGSYKGRVRPFVLAMDIKHMERFTAGANLTRYQMIRGSYSEAHQFMESQPYVTPTDSWSFMPKGRKRFVALSEVAEGCLVQYGSGHSAVANSQKELLTCALVDAHMALWGYSEPAAFEVVLAGESREVSMLNFGDDNFFSAYSQELLDQLFAYLNQYFDVQKEDPPKFLGFEWDGALNKFVLTRDSYVLKTYLHERAPLGRFRDLAFLGWKLKREIFLAYGRPSEMEEVFEFENQLLASYGLRWRDIEAQARNEAKVASGDIAFAHPLLLFGKDYLMTDEEKLMSGQFVGWEERTVAQRFAELTRGGYFEGALG